MGRKRGKRTHGAPSQEAQQAIRAVLIQPNPIRADSGWLKAQLVQASGFSESTVTRALKHWVESGMALKVQWFVKSDGHGDTGRRCRYYWKHHEFYPEGAGNAQPKQWAAYVRSAPVSSEPLAPLGFNSVGVRAHTGKWAHRKGVPAFAWIEGWLLDGKHSPQQQPVE